MSRWTDAFLDPMREVGDPVADDVIRSLHGARGIEAVNRVMRELVRNDQAVPEGFPPELRAWFEETEPLVREEEWPAIRTAERLFSTHGTTVLMLLGFSALPQTYAATRGARVLIFTQRLTRDTQRRLLETFQFVLNVMREGGMGPAGRGLRDAQKVRLMHAAIRAYVHREPDYDADWGLPINQEDLAGTLCAFSVVILDGFRRIGLTIDDEEEAAWITAWNVVGRTLGLRDDMLPRDPADSRALWDAVKRRQFGPSDVGKQLTAALMAFYDRYLPEALDGMPPTQIRFFAGDEIADWLGLPKSDWTRVVVWLGNFVDVGVHDVEDRSQGLSKLAAFVGPALLGGIDRAARGGDRPLFDIPLPLRNAWNIPSFSPPKTGEVDRAIRAAQEKLAALQRPDGTYIDPNDGGPQFTAMTVLAEKFLGVLEPGGAAEAVRWLRNTQLPDGSWGGYAMSREGSVGATSVAWAALLAAGVPATDPAVLEAAAWMATHGGPSKADPMAQMFLVLGGHLSPDEIAAPPVQALLLPVFDELVARMTQGFYLVMLYETAMIVAGLKARGGHHAGPLERKAMKKGRAYLEARQDPSGSWLGVFPITLLGAVALVLSGVPLADDRVQRALRRTDGWKVRTSFGTLVQPYTSDVWDVAMCTRVLVESGVPKDDPRVVSGIRFLLQQQNHTPQPWDLSTAKPGSPRTGGWAFEKDNPFGMDCDSTAEVLATLGTAADPTSPGVQAAIARGRAWLLGMQNDDGGWAAFGWGHATKQPGPFGTAPFTPPTTAGGLAELFLSPPSEITDPSSEEIVARALFGLSRIGFTGGEIAAGVQFLQDQQWVNHAWWGRWTCNFTSATGYVISGLMSVGISPHVPWVKAALDWLESKQNPDGGWGESLDTYRFPERAGMGPSTPTQTALVVTALIDADRAAGQPVADGVHWLLRHQKDGAWKDPFAMNVLVPPDSFYSEELVPMYSALQALARWRKANP